MKERVEVIESIEGIDLIEGIEAIDMIEGIERIDTIEAIDMIEGIERIEGIEDDRDGMVDKKILRIEKLFVSLQNEILSVWKIYKSEINL